MFYKMYKKYVNINCQVKLRLADIYAVEAENWKRFAAYSGSWHLLPADLARELFSFKRRRRRRARARYG